MVTRQLNFKLLKQKLPSQQSSYAKNFCSFRNEHQVFDRSPQRDSVFISHSLFSYVCKNRPYNALQMFKAQLQCDFPRNVDKEMVAIALKACRTEPRLGRQIHGFTVSSGFVLHSTVTNSMMNMYSKSGQFGTALCVFESLSNPCIVAWNTILAGFQKGEDAFSFALRMNYNGIKYDPVSYTTILSFCSDHEDFLSFGLQLHSHTVKSGLGCELFVGNALISLYSRSDNLSDARKIFDEMPIRDLVSWNAILSGYCQEEADHGFEAIFVFIEMVRERLQLDHISFTTVVSACGHMRNLELGKQIHTLVVKSGYRKHLSVCNVLMSTYAKSEDNEAAKLVFREMDERNVISWTSIISIEEENAMSLFNGMRLNGVYPNDVTFIGLLHAITTRSLIAEGKTVHGFCIKTGFLSELHICNSIITMYAKFQVMEDCLKFFDELSVRDITSWNSLITGCAQNGLSRKALQMFLLAVTKFRPNHYTFGSVLSAIADAEDISLEYGQRCHSYLIKFGLNTHPIVSSALLDMYAKRGSISESHRVFDETPKRSQIAWTSIISAYAGHGDSDSTIKLFREMEREGVKPDSITFLSLLTACSRNGLVHVGSELFESMSKGYSIEPSREHYACMVDLYGRAGKLHEAEELARKIPGGPGTTVLQSLVGACQTHGNLEMGEKLARDLMELEPNESGPYMVVSNFYAEKGDWENVSKVRSGMRSKGVKKVVGFSWVDIGGSMPLHGFSAGDKSHPRSQEIYDAAKCLGRYMKFLSEREVEHFLMGA